MSGLSSALVAGAAVLLAAAALVALLAPRREDVERAGGAGADGNENSGRNHDRNRANRPAADAGAA